MNEPDTIFVGIAVFVLIIAILYKYALSQTSPPALPPPENLEQRAGLLNENGVYVGHGINNKPLRDSGDRHIITFGPTGSGKNAMMQTPALLNYEGSALVIDVKGQLAAITALERQSIFSQEIYILNPFGSLGLPSCTYNPLRFIDPKSLTFATDARRLAEGLVIITKGDHWETAALDLVTLLIMWTVLYEEEKNLVTVRRLLNLPEGAPDDECTRQGFFTEMSKCRHPEIAEGAIRYTMDSKEVRDCIQTAVVQLGFMRDEAVANTLRGGGRELSFADLKRKGATAYVIIPPELLHTHGRFLRLVIMSALGEFLRERARPALPVLFMIDEFPALGPMPIIENAASIVRDYNVKMWFVLQNLPQLKSLYGNKWESFLSSAGVVQFFTPADLETAKYVSERSGIKKEIRQSKSTSSTEGGGRSDGGSNRNWSNGISTSETEHDVPRLSVQDVFDLHENKQILILPGISIALVEKRYPYWEHLKKGLNNWFIVLRDPYHMDAATRAKFDAWLASGETLFHRVIPYPKDENGCTGIWERFGFSSYEKAYDVLEDQARKDRWKELGGSVDNASGNIACQELMIPESFYVVITS